MMKKLKLKNLFLVAFFCGVFNFTASAGIGGSIGQTADVLKIGEYQARAHADIILNNGGGVNLSARFRTGLVKNFFDIEGILSFGKTDYQIGALTKFNLLPDLPNQLALSFTAGLSLIGDDISPKEDTFFLLQTGVIMSKNIQTNIGRIGPYAGLQLEAAFIDIENLYPITLNVGAELQLNEITPWVLIAEIGIDISDSFATLSLGGSYKF